MSLFFLLIAGILFTANINAQAINENNFTRFTTANGLSDNYITGLEQDANGYVWVSTNKGINRFDGSAFKVFLKNHRYNPIPDNSIYSIRLLDDDLALATNDGAQLISTKTLKHTNYNVPTSDLLRYWSNACLYTLRDGKGNLCVSTKTGFYVFSKEGKLKNRYDAYSDKDVGHSWMLFGNRLYYLPDGNIAQLNSKGLLLYDTRNNKIVSDSTVLSAGLKRILSIWKEQKTIFFTVSRSDVLILNFKTNSFELVNVETGHSKSFKTCFNFSEEIGWQSKLTRLYDNRWSIISKNKGFFILQIDTLTRTVHCSPEKYFSAHSCNTIFADKQKRLWVGTNKGLFMQKIKPGIIKTFPVDQEEHKDKVITSVFVTADKIFAGTSNREILILNKKTKQILDQLSLPRSEHQTNIINQIVPIRGDTAWLTSNKEIWWLNSRNHSYGKLNFPLIDDSINYINFLYPDRTGSIWINPNIINTVYKYTLTNGNFITISQKDFPKLKINALNAIAEDSEGNIWMSGDGIARWNRAKNQIDTLIEYLPTQNTPKKGFIVMADSKGHVWALVNDDGFARLTGKLIHIRPSNLTFNNTGNLYPGLLRNKVFIPTNEGVGYYDILRGKAVLFTTRDGIPDELVSSHRFVDDPTDYSTWFACKNIICNLSFSPEAFSLTAPSLIISELIINNGQTINYPSESIELKYDQNDLRLLFSGINFTDPENMRYAYRFKGNADSSWVEAGNQPNILLTNIGHGTYNLQVKVYAYDNKWPEQIKEMTIYIKPPFWRSTWFVLPVFMLLLGSAYYLYKRRIAGIQQKANLDNLLAQTEMKALHAQMNPHFIFNCLNSIREMILKNENIHASRYLSKFAQLIRITLDQSSKHLISLKETIEYLKRYLEMEQIRTDKFIYTLQVDEMLDLEELMIPPMLIQPFIENAIWHGQPAKGKMELTLEFFAEKGDLVCVIDDTGIGIEASLQKKDSTKNDHHSVGIENIKQRIRVLNEKYGTGCRLDIIDKTKLYDSASGTIVTLHFPINKTILQT